MTGHVCWPAVILTSVVKDKQKLNAGKTELILFRSKHRKLPKT